MDLLRTFARLAWHPYFRGKSRLVSSLPISGTHRFSLPWGDMYLDARNRHQRQMAFGVYERAELGLVKARQLEQRAWGELAALLNVDSLETKELDGMVDDSPRL